jgi:transglutaminase-like putative cysteine protease
MVRSRKTVSERARSRAAKYCVLAVGSCLLFGIAAHAEHSPDAGSLYRLAPRPNWIEVVTPEYAAEPPAAGVSGGAWYLLLDRQINVTAAGDDYHQHLAMKVLTAESVEDESQFNIKLDPTYQSLDIHSINVVRNGNVIDERASARITALPQETELRSKIYNGAYNVNVLLSDVRPGDIIDYDYTVHSRENIFAGHFAGSWDVGWSMPVHWQRIRIRYPLGREMRFRLSSSAPIPAPKTKGNVREFELQWKDVPLTVADDDRPGWYAAWPYLEASDLKDWSAVAALVSPLYSERRSDSPAFAAIIRDIRAGGGSAEEQALRALQYVQEEIRYVSIDIGPAAFRPADPDTVLQRRFGDCKDKSLLLASVLRRLDIAARPALVHSRRGRTLTSTLPTPYAFDHAIVYARIGKNDYWLDATGVKQYSPLSIDSPADFEHALIMDSESRELSTIPRPSPGSSGKFSAVVVDMSDGIDKPAKLEVKTSYMGRSADEVRRTLARGSPEQRQSDYANYMARYYPGAKTSAPISVHDDQTRNVLEIREYYTLDHPFVKESDGDPTFLLQADEIYRLVNPLSSSVRQAPLSVDYPMQVRQNIKAILPGEWPVKSETVTVENPAFKYQSKVSYAMEDQLARLELDYRYEATSDQVELAALERYRIDRKRVSDDAGYTLRHKAGDRVSDAHSLSLAPLPAAALLLSFALSIWAAVRWGYRYDPPIRKADPGSPRGIRGWLCLPAIVAVVSPLVSAWLIANLARFIDVDVWDGLPLVTAAPYRAWSHPVLLAVVSLAGPLLVGQILAAVLFFKKRSSVPTVLTAVWWFALFYGAVALYFFSTVNIDDTQQKPVAESIKSLVSTVIWSLYMWRSQRVKATFVQRNLASDTIS